MEAELTSVGQTAKVYIVASGSLCELDVRAMFSTRAAADSYAHRYHMEPDRRAGTESLHVEEWSLDDPLAIQTRLTRYFVSLDRHGDREDVEAVSWDQLGGPESIDDDLELNVWIDGGVYGHVLATDEEHAIRIASEYRVQLLAECEPTE